MQKNDFEKNVQQKMDELQLYPSAELWPEVERRIRKEKKRRWFIFWLLIPALLAGSGIAIYLLAKKGITTNMISQSKMPIEGSSIINNTGSTNKNNSSSITVAPLHAKDSLVSNEQTVLKETTNEISQSGKTISTVKQKVNERSRFVFQSGQGNKMRSVKPRNEKKEESVKKEDFVVPVLVKTETKEPAVTKIVEQPAQQEQSLNLVNDTISTLTIIVKESKPITDTILAKEPEKIIMNADSSKQTDQVTNQLKKNKNKWELGTTMSIGLSNRVNGFSLGEEKMLAAPQASIGGGGLSDSRARSYFDSRSGLFWEAGIYAQKKTEKRTTVSAGLSVSSFNTRQPVGDFADSLISADANGYYRYGNESVYNSHYYYLEIPLLFHWQVNKGKKFPLVWKNGLSPSFLVSSKALIYNNTVKGFYRDKTSMNKFQLAFRTGLYTRFDYKSGHPLSAGLFMNYNLTGLQGVNQFERNKLFSFGFQLLIPFKKN